MALADADCATMRTRPVSGAGSETNPAARVTCRAFYRIRVPPDAGSLLGGSDPLEHEYWRAPPPAGVSIHIRAGLKSDRESVRALATTRRRLVDARWTWWAACLAGHHGLSRPPVLPGLFQRAGRRTRWRLALRQRFQPGLGAGCEAAGAVREHARHLRHSR